MQTMVPVLPEPVLTKISFMILLYHFQFCESTASDYSGKTLTICIQSFSFIPSFIYSCSKQSSLAVTPLHSFMFLASSPIHSSMIHFVSPTGTHLLITHYSFTHYRYLSETLLIHYVIRPTQCSFIYDVTTHPVPIHSSKLNFLETETTCITLF